MNEKKMERIGIILFGSTAKSVSKILENSFHVSEDNEQCLIFEYKDTYNNETRFIKCFLSDDISENILFNRMNMLNIENKKNINQAAKFYSAPVIPEKSGEENTNYVFCLCTKYTDANMDYIIKKFKSEPIIKVNKLFVISAKYKLKIKEYEGVKMIETYEDFIENLTLRKVNNRWEQFAQDLFFIYPEEYRKLPATIIIFNSRKELNLFENKLGYVELIKPIIQKSIWMHEGIKMHLIKTITTLIIIPQLSNSIDQINFIKYVLDNLIDSKIFFIDSKLKLSFSSKEKIKINKDILSNVHKMTFIECTEDNINSIACDMIDLFEIPNLGHAIKDTLLNVTIIQNIQKPSDDMEILFTKPKVEIQKYVGYEARISNENLSKHYNSLKLETFFVSPDTHANEDMIPAYFEATKFIKLSDPSYWIIKATFLTELFFIINYELSTSEQLVIDIFTRKSTADFKSMIPREVKLEFSVEDVYFTNFLK